MDDPQALDTENTETHRTETPKTSRHTAPRHRPLSLIWMAVVMEGAEVIREKLLHFVTPMSGQRWRANHKRWKLFATVLFNLGKKGQNKQTNQGRR